ncbi:MAG: DUF1127 domain-containing protein [Anderseniella sp.]|jgi:uncharacterized protein YjiS (DUF1127 family)|nr:DUF1127 domain-containing protein [Anderseniella sp.]
MGGIDARRWQDKPAPSFDLLPSRTKKDKKMSRNRRHIAIAHPLQGLNPVPLLTSASRRFTQWRQHRIAVRDLQNLDHRMLKDIGLDRSEILAAACGTLDRNGRRGRNANCRNKTQQAR